MEATQVEELIIKDPQRREGVGKTRERTINFKGRELNAIQNPNLPSDLLVIILNSWPTADSTQPAVSDILFHVVSSYKFCLLLLLYDTSLSKRLELLNNKLVFRLILQTKYADSASEISQKLPAVSQSHICISLQKAKINRLWLCWFSINTSNFTNSTGTKSKKWARGRHRGEPGAGRIIHTIPTLIM